MLYIYIALLLVTDAVQYTSSWPVIAKWKFDAVLNGIKKCILFPPKPLALFCWIFFYVRQKRLFEDRGLENDALKSEMKISISKEQLYLNMIFFYIEKIRSVKTAQRETLLMPIIPTSFIRSFIFIAIVYQVNTTNFVYLIKRCCLFN